MRLTSLPILASAAILAGALVSCSGRKEADPQAQALYDGASEAFQARDYSRATLLLDSLQKTFPSETDPQRETRSPPMIPWWLRTVSASRNSVPR